MTEKLMVIHGEDMTIPQLERELAGARAKFYEARNWYEQIESYYNERLKEKFYEFMKVKT